MCAHIQNYAKAGRAGAAVVTAIVVGIAKLQLGIGSLFCITKK